MENNRNWQGWAALALAGLALLVALMGRNPGPAVTVEVGAAPGDARAGVAQPGPRAGGREWRDAAPAAPAAPQAPGEWRGQQDGPGFGPGAQQFGRGPHGDFAQGHHGRGGFPFFLPFMLIGGLIKLAGVVLIAFLLVRFFKGRRDRPQPPVSPTTQV